MPPDKPATLTRWRLAFVGLSAACALAGVSAYFAVRSTAARQSSRVFYLDSPPEYLAELLQKESASQLLVWPGLEAWRVESVARDPAGLTSFGLVAPDGRARAVIKLQRHRTKDGQLFSYTAQNPADPRTMTYYLEILPAGRRARVDLAFSRALSSDLIAVLSGDELRARQQILAESARRLEGLPTQDDRGVE